MDMQQYLDGLAPLPPMTRLSLLIETCIDRGEGEAIGIIAALLTTVEAIAERDSDVTHSAVADLMRGIVERIDRGERSPYIRAPLAQ